ncbi:hypothetical protein AGMMS50262_00260 [Bacteroidia bacterium]|nr:hypothetical protein AGMMS50262_00260 [Bacteroidia bacterium]
MNVKIAGVRRGNRFSPNSVGNDTVIFNLTVEHLRKKGCEVTEYSEDEFLQTTMEADMIFNMARDMKSLRKLQRLEDAGVKVVNSGYGIENCTREKMTRLLLAHDIPHPKSVIVRTDEQLPQGVEWLANSCWIKRGDVHAIYSEDVTYVQVGEEAGQILQNFASRGIPSAVINEHLEGDLIKFYGVEGTDFFQWMYPDRLNHSKFGLEAVNGDVAGYSFDLELLKEYCSRVAHILNIHIYGGDGVVDKNGKVRIIDFNDWPSFAVCRNEAAPAITGCIIENLLS